MTIAHRMLAQRRVSAAPKAVETITLGSKVRFKTPRGNPGKIDLELIEVQTSSYLGEDDIVRIEGDYHRS
jgi:mannose-6-phosphate isomerase-like protein (cupin superfamily)